MSHSHVHRLSGCPADGGTRMKSAVRLKVAVDSWECNFSWSCCKNESPGATSSHSGRGASGNRVVSTNSLWCQV